MRTVLHLRSSGAMLGAESVVLSIAKRSSAFGFRSIIGVLRSPADPAPELAARAAEMGVETTEFPLRRRYDVGPIAALRQFVASAGVDVVHTHGYRENAFVLASFLGVPRIATNHLWKLNTSRLRLLAALDAQALRLFPKVVAVSEEISKDMVSRGVSPTRIRVIHNGLDDDLVSRRPSVDARAQARAALQIADGRFVIMMVSSLTTEKSHEVAIGALSLLRAQAPEVELVIVGSGPQEAQLRHLAQLAGLNANVRFAGWRSDAPELLIAADAFLITSWQEGLPIALLEAMACGLPVVSTPVGAIPAALAGGCGVVVPSGDPRVVADAIQDLLRDPASRDRMGEAARARVIERFSASRMTAGYCEEYSALLGARSPL